MKKVNRGMAHRMARFPMAFGWNLKGPLRIFSPTPWIDMDHMGGSDSASCRLIGLLEFANPVDSLDCLSISPGLSPLCDGGVVAEKSDKVEKKKGLRINTDTFYVRTRYSKAACISAKIRT